MDDMQRTLRWEYLEETGSGTRFMEQIMEDVGKMDYKGLMDKNEWRAVRVV